MEKLSIVIVHAAQQLRHYLVLRKTIVVASLNPFQYILSHHLIGGKFSKWIVILQEFDMEFISTKSKKCLVFAELILELPRVDQEEPLEECTLDDYLFLINSSDPWYGNILVYLQTMQYHPNFSHEKRQQLQLHCKNYLIIDNTLYHHGGYFILHLYLTRKEVEKTLNDCHGGSYGGHLYGLETTHKIFHAGYFLAINLQRLRRSN